MLCQDGLEKEQLTFFASVILGGLSQPRRRVGEGMMEV